MSTPNMYDQNQPQNQDLSIPDIIESERSPQLDKVFCRDRKTCVCSSSSNNYDSTDGGGGFEGGGGDARPQCCIPCWRDTHPVSPTTRPFFIDDNDNDNDTNLPDFDTLSTTSSSDEADLPNNLSDSTALLSSTSSSLALSKLSLDPSHPARIPSLRALHDLLTHLNHGPRLGFLPSDNGETWPPEFSSAMMSPLSASMHVDVETPSNEMNMSIAALSSVSGVLPMSGTSSTFLACNGAWVDERRAAAPGVTTGMGILRPPPVGRWLFVGWPIYLGHERDPFPSGMQARLKDGAAGMEGSMCGWSEIQMDEADYA